MVDRGPFFFNPGPMALVSTWIGKSLKVFSYEKQSVCLSFGFRDSLRVPEASIFVFSEVGLLRWVAPAQQFS